MEKGVYNPEATGTKPVRHLAIDILLIKKAAALLRVVNHKLRQQILLLLHAKGSSVSHRSIPSFDSSSQ